VSNPRCQERKKIFERLSKYKKIDSYGKFLNNMGYDVLPGFDTKEFLDVVGQYKFIVTFENSQKGYYITEKICHGYLAHTIPIYWGSANIEKYFNVDSMVYIRNYDKDVERAIERIIELDNDDAKWLQCANQNPFSCDIDQTFQEDCDKVSNMIVSKNSILNNS